MGIKLAIGILVVVLIGIFVFASFFLFGQGTFVQLKEPNLIHYVGRATQTYQNNLIVTTQPAKIGDYTIEMSLTNIAEQKASCRSNSCNGIQSSTDVYGCPIYSASTQAGYYCTSSECYCYQTNQNGYPLSPLTYAFRTGSGGYIGASNPLGNTNACGGSAEYRASQPYTCGGAETTSARGCYYTYKISNGGQIVEEEKTFITGNRQFSLEGLEVSLYASSEYQDAQCNWIQNTYTIKPPADAFNFDLVPSRQSFIQGEPATIEMTITNNWVNAVVDVTSRVCQPTFGSEHCEDVFAGSVSLAKGQAKTVSFSIPTSFIVEKLKVTPTLKIRLDTSTYSITNLNNDCYRKDGKSAGSGVVSTDQCAYLDLGTWEGNTTTVLVNPKPIYVDVGCPEKACPSDYQCQTDSGLCLRTDIIEKELSCQQIGCPVTPDKTYQCSSAGICVETVFQYLDCKDKGCPNGATCETSSGVCINTVIYRELTQCNTASDCMKPCDGITASCVADRCQYLGECKTTVFDCQQLGCAEGYVCSTRGTCERTIETNNTITKDCRQIGCPSGYLCNYDVGTCLKTEYVSKDCSTNGCDYGYDCNTARGVCERIVIEYRDRDCATNGCANEYECNKEKGVCERTIVEYVKQNCKELGCVDGYDCNESRGVCERTIEKKTIVSELPLWAIALFIALIIIIISFVVYVSTRKPKRRR